MELQQLKDIFALMNVRTFCDKYDLNYTYITRILNDKKALSEKQSIIIAEALEKFKKDLLLQF